MTQWGKNKHKHLYFNVLASIFSKGEVSSLLYFKSLSEIDEYVKPSITHAVVSVLFLICLAKFITSNLRGDPQYEYQELLIHNNVMTLNGILQLAK